MSGGFRGNIVWTALGIPLCLCTLLYSIFGRRRIVLQDKVVLLTGAAGGLGQALAEVLYEAGCKVILSGRQSKALEAIRDRLSNKKKSRCHVPAIIVMDLSDKADIPEKAKKAVDIFGHIDILVNNAGVGTRGWIHETDLEVFEKVMKVNFLGQLYLTKALLPHMMERESGHIVVISSVQGRMGLPCRAPYGASKHALHSFFDSFRAELSMYNIGVSTACPGYIRTNFSVNATNPDGSGYNKMDKTTANGYDPMYVARKIIKGVAQGKEEILIAPFYVYMAICLRTMAPWLFFKLMEIRARNALKHKE